MLGGVGGVMKGGSVYMCRGTMETVCISFNELGGKVGRTASNTSERNINIGTSDPFNFFTKPSQWWDSQLFA